MTISVVIPTIPERADMLARAVRSVARQTLPADEICIAVAGPGEGAPSTRTRALHMATGEWVAFLDDDDEFEPHHLAACARHAEETGADLVFPYFTVVGGTDPFPHHFGQPWDPQGPRQTTVVTFARRTAVLAVGGFEAPLSGTEAPDGNRHGEDYEMILRLNAAGYRIEHLAERTWLWHHHYSNTSGLPERRPSVVHSGA